MDNNLSIYDRQYLNWLEKLTIKSLKKKWWKKMNEKNAMEANEFHYMAEKIRARHGYSGGWSGNEFIPYITHPWLA